MKIVIPLERYKSRLTIVGGMWRMQYYGIQPEWSSKYYYPSGSVQSSSTPPSPYFGLRVVRNQK